jgi:toxin ParE1/3/4
MNWRLSRRAAEDLWAIYEYRAQQSEETAQRVLSSIFATIRRAALYPLSGRPGARPRTREIVVTDYPYIIPYRVQGDELIVLRIFHTRQRR